MVDRRQGSGLPAGPFSPPFSSADTLFQPASAPLQPQLPPSRPAPAERTAAASRTVAALPAPGRAPADNGIMGTAYWSEFMEADLLPSLGGVEGWSIPTEDQWPPLPGQADDVVILELLGPGQDTDTDMMELD